MSQYPSPYTPPPYYPQYAGYYPQRDLLAPARRASWLMLVIAALLCVCGVCIAGFSRVNLADLPAESQPQFQQFDAQLQQLGLSMKAALIIYGLMAFLPGLAMAVLAFFVRRGGLVSLILALVVTVPILLLVALAAGSALIAGGAQGISGVCMVMPLLVGLIVLLTWLIQALRVGPQISTSQAQYQAYYQQYQQAQQAYLQAYGYGMPQQPPPSQQPPQAPPTTQGPNDAPPQA